MLASGRVEVSAEEFFKERDVSGAEHTHRQEALQDVRLTSSQPLLISLSRMSRNIWLSTRGVNGEKCFTLKS